MAKTCPWGRFQARLQSCLWTWRTLAEYSPWLVLSTLSIQPSGSRLGHEPTWLDKISTGRMGRNKALGAECTIMQLLGGTYRNPCPTCSYILGSPLPNTARTGELSAPRAELAVPRGQVVQVTKPPDNGVEAADGRLEGGIVESCSWSHLLSNQGTEARPKSSFRQGSSAINFWCSGLFYLQALAPSDYMRGLGRDRRKSKTANRSTATCSQALSINT
jgi:hypothetical protein